jgi:hypothetical protein
VLAVALIYQLRVYRLSGRHELTPKDYLFLGAVSGSRSDPEVPETRPPALGRHGLPPERPPAAVAGATRPWWEH